MLSLLDVHPGCAVTIHDSKTHPLSTCLGHWRIQCSQYHTTPPPKCKSDEEESLAGDKVTEINTKPPNNKHGKTHGTKKKGVVPMFSKNKQDHVASLETSSAKADDHNEEKKPMQGATHIQSLLMDHVK